MSDFDEPRPQPDPEAAPMRRRRVEPSRVEYPDDEWGAPADEGWEDEQWDDGAYDTGRWVEWSGPTSKSRRILAAVVVILAVVALVVGGLWFWVQRQIDPPGAPGDEIVLEIPAGATTEDIGRQLADEGIIANASVWNYWVRFNDVGGFDFGEYTFQENSSFDEAVEVLEAGPRPPESERVGIPEGLTVAEIVARLGDPELGLDRWDPALVQAAIDDPSITSAFQPASVTSMEGFLFPDTYDVGEDEDERTFVRRLVTQMDTVLREADIENRAAALGVTPYQVVIIASLIEEEARVDGDRAKIARVIYNRLEQGIPLGIDATSRYEAEIEGRSRDDLDFSSDSPYNTRRVQGLPPTPIAAPGRASIEAALAPEDGPWTFYVLETETEHFFTDSNAEFLEAKERCRVNGLGCG